MQRAGGRPDGIDTACMPGAKTNSDFRTRFILNAAWRNLDAWVRHGVPAPRARWLLLREGTSEPDFDPAKAFVTDDFGNAVGGVRSLEVEVPTTRWIGAMTGGFRCMFYGYKLPPPAGALADRYGNAAEFSRQVRDKAQQLEAQRWLTPTDRAAAVSSAPAMAVEAGIATGSSNRKDR